MASFSPQRNEEKTKTTSSVSDPSEKKKMVSFKRWRSAYSYRRSKVPRSRCCDSLEDMKALPSNDEAFALRWGDINDIIKSIRKRRTPAHETFWEWCPYKVSFYLKMCTFYGVDYQNLEESSDSSDDDSDVKTQLPSTQLPFDMIHEISTRVEEADLNIPKEMPLKKGLPTCVEFEHVKYQAALMYAQGASYCSSATDPDDFRYHHYRHLGLGLELELPTCLKFDSETDREIYREKYNAALLDQMYEEDLTGEKPTRSSDGPFKSGSYLPGREPDRIPYHLYLLVKEALDIMKHKQINKAALAVVEAKICFFCRYFHSHLPTGWVYNRNKARSLIADYDPKRVPKYRMSGYIPTKDLDDWDFDTETYLTEYTMAGIMGIIYSRKTPKLEHSSNTILFYCKLCSCFGIDYLRLEDASEDDVCLMNTGIQLSAAELV